MKAISLFFPLMMSRNMTFHLPFLSFSAKGMIPEQSPFSANTIFFRQSSALPDAYI